MAAQHLPPWTVLTKLSRVPTLCAAWVGMHRHVTTRNQGIISKQREDPGNKVTAVLKSQIYNPVKVTKKKIPGDEAKQNIQRKPNYN